MTKSAAKKLRDKAVREGKRNPECNRSPFVFTDMRSRKTKTKKDYLYRSKHKNLTSEESRRDGSFYFADLTTYFIKPCLDCRQNSY
ncbi:hypothetical protein BK139_12380 [Paenibacillus sp. FSL R5-0490]|uniref:hypothetical protein n=1 Tax=Bacillales TaxID=1385 RepID=UPI00096D8173|nr:hypothetical protein [Paenibacillus sp. FSL R5-0490]OMF59588.1 hypothetical protein BK139_12380 [Paenibacillus sp. FSL R5-0490]